MNLDKLSITDLNWWLQTLPSAVAPINRGVATCVFTCDASDEGWSGCFNGEKANGHFSLVEAPFSTNTKEILLVLYSICSHVKHFRSKHILALSDSTMAISVVKSMGSMDNMAHDVIAQDIWKFAEKNEIWISISHIPGKFNFESDNRSCVLSSSTKWAMPQETFDKLLKHFRKFGPVIMDLFVSRLNYKMKPYCSYGPDLYCTHCDSFTMSWDSPYIYFANAPFSVIPKILQKVHQQNSTMMITFPFWQQQMWLNRLLEMLISEIVILP